MRGKRKKPGESREPLKIRNNEDLVRLYEFLYKQPVNKLGHPKRGNLGLYGSHTNRDPAFIRYIQKNVPEGGRVLDASCGRGHLAITLRELGYDAEGTEISPWLVEHVLQKVLPVVHCLRYDELDQLPEKSYDAVCSNDVLEHLLNDQSAIDAIESLARLARSHVLVSVGFRRSGMKYAQSLNFRRINNLHYVRHGGDWWRDQIAKHVEIEFEAIKKRGAWFFGRVK